MGHLRLDWQQVLNRYWHKDLMMVVCGNKNDLFRYVYVKLETHMEIWSTNTKNKHIIAKFQHSLARTSKKCFFRYVSNGKGEKISFQNKMKNFIEIKLKSRLKF